MARFRRAMVLRRAVLLLWDECTMLSKEFLEIIDRHLRDLMGNELPFGGKSKRDLVYNIQNRPLTVTKRMEREPQLCKLIKGMLTKDWEKRISVDDALRNRWLAS